MITATQIVADVRQLSSLFNNTLLSDAQVVKLFNDGATELYDWMVGTFETWFLTSVDFTLAGGVGGNSFPMPMDLLLKDNTLELNPTNNTPCPVPRLSTWSDRNRMSYPIGVGGGRRYFPAGSNLMVFPPNLAAGNYRLWYTPKYVPIGLQGPPGTAPVLTGFEFNSGGGLIDFTGTSFSSANVGDTVVSVGDGNPANNFTSTIIAVPSPTVIQVALNTIANEGSPTATITTQPVGTTFAFNTVMEPWVLYPEVHASIAIRSSRQQDTSDLEPKLAQLKQRIETATSNRTQEVPQSPLRDNSGWNNWFYGGG